VVNKDFPNDKTGIHWNRGYGVTDWSRCRASCCDWCWCSRERRVFDMHHWSSERYCRSASTHT